MNIKRIIFWIGFVLVLGLIIWGLIASINKENKGPKLGKPAPISATDHVRGPEDARVTLIEYSDFQCPACQAYHPLIEKIFASSTIPFRMVYRHYPLPQHPNAFISAQASEAAALQGKFWEMQNLIFTYHTEWTELKDPRDVFVGYAQRIGLNVISFKNDMNGTFTKDAVSKQLAEGQSIGVNSTPTFFLNGNKIENPQSYEQFETAIKAAAN